MDEKSSSANWSGRTTRGCTVVGGRMYVEEDNFDLLLFERNNLNRFKGLFGDTLVIVDDDDVDEDEEVIVIEEGGVPEPISMLEPLLSEA
jgi:hypothetical protein